MADLFHGPTTVHFTFVLMAFLGERRALLLRQFSKSIFVSIVLKTSFLKESFILKCFLLFSISHPLNMGDTYLFMWVVGHSWTWKQLSLFISCSLYLLHFKRATSKRIRNFKKPSTTPTFDPTPEFLFTIWWESIFYAKLTTTVIPQA